jgi:hypothetical protein
MVADAEQAGKTILCPNCHRNLRVPSGKGRGMELKAPPPAAQLSATPPPPPPGRTCDRCGEGVSPDAQICPHCNNILLDAGGGGGKGPSRPLAVRLGGSRQTWWSRLSPGGRGGVVAGIVAAALLAVLLVFAILMPYNTGAQIVDGRRIAKQVIEEGAQLEAQGNFQEAYDQYFVGLIREKYLQESALKSDRDLVEQLRERIRALDYIVPSRRTAGIIWWKARNQAELDAARDLISARYPVYRQRFLAVTGAAMDAIRTARSSGSQQQYQAGLGGVMNAYMNLVTETTPEQRAMWSFDVLIQVLRELAGANRNWNTDRVRFLGIAETRIEMIEKRVREPPITPEGDILKSD